MISADLIGSNHQRDTEMDVALCHSSRPMPEIVSSLNPGEAAMLAQNKDSRAMSIEATPTPHQATTFNRGSARRIQSAC